MTDSASSPAIKSASSFASLLESLTGPAKKTDDLWDDSTLLDDVATISYEQALRSHRRVPLPVALPADEPSSSAVAANPQALPVAPVKKRKTASITIRLTESEEAQLRERAEAAQLSVSAYLRSCIFEAEALRAQVKKAVNQMRAASDPLQVPGEKRPPSTESRSFHFFPHWSRRQKTDN